MSESNKKITIEEHSNKKINIKNIAKYTIGIIIGILIVIGIAKIIDSNIQKEMCKTYINLNRTNNAPDTMIELNTTNNELNINLVKVGAKLKNEYIRVDLDKDKENKLIGFELFDNSILLNYEKEDGDIYAKYIGYDEEVLKPYKKAIGEKEINNILKEPNEKMIVDTTRNDKNEIVSITELGSLYREGYTLAIRATQDKYLDKDKSFDFRYTISFTKDSEHTKEVKLGNIMYINFENIEGLQGKIGFAYDNNTNLFRVINTDSYNTILFIMAMNNQSIGNTEEDLVQYKDYKDVYIDIHFDDNSSFQYRGFAIKDGENTIYFRIGETVDNPYDFLDKLLILMNK